MTDDRPVDQVEKSDRLAAVPEELRARPQWVLWVGEADSQTPGRVKKVPIAPSTGRRASVADPSTWCDFDGARLAVEPNDVEGVGFVLTADDPFVGIDLDHCLNDQGELSSEARELVARFNSYTEVSPSGTGLHIFVRGVLTAGGRRRDGIEVYDRGRYFTVTGDHLRGTPSEINERSVELRHLYESLGAAGRDFAPVEPVRGPQRYSDDEVLRRCNEGRNGGRFSALYDGSWRPADYPSQSEADLAFCGFLSKWTQDPEQMDRLVRQSGLFREKWDDPHDGEGETYGHHVVRMAIDSAEPQRNALPWVTAAELAELTSPNVDWVVEGLFARGAVTDLIGSAKVGKTTFVLSAIRALLDREPFLGRQTSQCSVVYLSEERYPTLREAIDRVGIVSRDRLHVLARDGSYGHAWPDVVDDAVQRARQHEAGLLVVDTLPVWAGFEGEEENTSGAALRAMRPLHAAAQAGLAVVFLRHSRKSGGKKIVDLGRGSTAIAGASDLLVSLRDDRQGVSNRRQLDGQGRFDSVIQSMVIEWRSDRYVAVGQPGVTPSELVLEALPLEGDEPATMKALQESLQLTRRALDSCLKSLVAEGKVISRSGYGDRHTAKGYWRSSPV